MLTNTVATTAQARRLSEGSTPLPTASAAPAWPLVVRIRFLNACKPLGEAGELALPCARNSPWWTPGAWLQLWLQLAAFALVRQRPRLYEWARQAAYGATVNRTERDHDGLAVWEAHGCASLPPMVSERGPGHPRRDSRPSSSRPRA
jgi:hypothetical protein